MIRSVGIVSKPIKDVVCSIVPPLMEWLRERNIAVFTDTETQECIGQLGTGVPRQALAGKIDLLIVLGGDGTLLSAVRALAGHRVPILPVNLGGLGFLTSVTREEMYPALEHVLAGQHRLSERMMLEAEVWRNGSVIERQTALNDAVVNKAARARMLEFDVFVDRAHVGRYRADGLIIATPTGSTAYSLSAGGPIVHPEVDALLITPICPHMLTNRPLAVPDTARVEIVVAVAGEAAHLTLDGQTGIQLEPDDRVAVTKSANRVALIRPPQKTYFEVLRNKLRWGER